MFSDPQEIAAKIAAANYNIDAVLNQRKQKTAILAITNQQISDERKDLIKYVAQKCNDQFLSELKRAISLGLFNAIGTTFKDLASNPIDTKGYFSYRNAEFSLTRDDSQAWMLTNIKTSKSITTSSLELEETILNFMDIEIEETTLIQ